MRYNGEINRAKAIWDMAQAARCDEQGRRRRCRRILRQNPSESALDSVQKNLNLASADLEMNLVDEKSSDNKAGPVQAAVVVNTPKTIESGRDSLDLDINVVEPAGRTLKPLV